MKKRKQKELKVSISEKGKYVLRLRFTHNSKPYELTVKGQDTEAWNKALNVKAAIIEDCKKGLFDCSLQKYKLNAGCKKSCNEPNSQKLSFDFVLSFKLYLEEKGYLEPNLATD